jgi:hypothetical protein
MVSAREERIKKMQEKKEALDRKIREEIAAENKEKRKQETREKIELGGIVKIAFPDGIDKGILLGILLESNELLTSNEAKKIEFKRHGDRVLGEREATGKRNIILASGSLEIKGEANSIG